MNLIVFILRFPWWLHFALAGLIVWGGMQLDGKVAERQAELEVALASEPPAAVALDVFEPGTHVGALDEGRVLAQHEGVIHYTIGQRRGLGIGGLSEPLYVVKLDVDKKQVVVGPKEMLATRRVPVREINWIGGGKLTDKDEHHIAVRVRSTRPPTDAILRPTSETEAEVELLVAEQGVSPGQACVFYDPDSSRVLGGGWIWSGHNAR